MHRVLFVCRNVRNVVASQTDFDHQSLAWMQVYMQGDWGELKGEQRDRGRKGRGGRYWGGRVGGKITLELEDIDVFKPERPGSKP